MDGSMLISQAVDVDLDSDDVVTVETLNDEIADLIDDQTDLNHDYVVGDVSGCRDSNGHVHFDLVFEDASIHCVLFGFRRSQTTVEPEAEMQVAVRGELSFYEPQGSCSILVTDVVDMGESDYSQIYRRTSNSSPRMACLLMSENSLSRNFREPLGLSHLPTAMHG